MFLYRKPASKEFDPDRGCLAAADAQRRDTSFFTEFFQCIHQGDDDAGPGGADGVALGAGAAVYIDLFVIKAEVLHAVGKEPKDNARFVVTNMRHKPERIWEIFFPLRPGRR